MRKKYNQATNYRLPTTDWQSGQSLIEVIVAFGITVVVAVALITTTLYTQRSTRSARNHALATKLVQENIEQVRIFRDRKGYSELPGPAGAGECYFLDTTAMDPKIWEFETRNSCPAEEITLENAKFGREIQVSGVVTEKKQIDVIVTWQESNQTFTVTSKTFLSQWDTSRL